MFVFSFKKSLQISSCLGILAIPFLQAPVSAQVIEDGTLPTRVKTTDNLNFTIDSINNNNRARNNLFHSFKEFSIPTGGSVIFNNSPDVVNIINRVTGGNISNIDGLIKANGNVNLFLINPNGIVFGKNARLDIGGSFFASTADSIKFADDIEFSAIDTTNTPLLSIKVPLGLQMGSNSRAIEVQGDGYTNASNSNNGLQVKSENILGLIGGDIYLNGGVIKADSGKVELGSVKKGLVHFDLSLDLFNYDNVANFGDIKFSKKALADASGEISGLIQLQAKNVSIAEGSKVFIQTRGLESRGKIKLKATEYIEVVGSSLDGSFSSTLLTETNNIGNAAKIEIITPSLLVSQGAVIITQTFSSGRGGDINIDASKSLQISESSMNPINDTEISTLAFNSGTAGDINILTKQFSILQEDVQTRNFGIGNGGNISVSTENLELINGGGIASISLGIGLGGDVKIDAKSIQMIGSNLNTFLPSVLSASTIGMGNAGNLTVNTRSLVVENGGRVDSSTVASGNSGSITINATDFIKVNGTVPGSINPSLIISSANILDPSLQKFLGLSGIPTGDSGNVIINTPVLEISNGAEVTVKNDGTGKGGMLHINANSILLNSKGNISASTQSGEGGNIDLQIKDGLILRNQSFISAESFGTGNGGNININSPVIAGLENSDIIANAVEGNGGNININTSGLFGLQFRDELTTDSDITATSQFGVNGTVDINNPAIDPSSSLTQLPTDVFDSSQEIASGCSTNLGNSFTFVGKGGLAENPQEVVAEINTWRDLRDLSTINSDRKRSIKVKDDYRKPIVEATGWVVDEKGNIEFVAQSNHVNPTENWQEASNCKGEVSIH